ncbi:DivIVA domain-containing protein [Prauserella rugosa]|uniref:DivIVA domain-containing protein n=1 Tax=Prauserella rugosa TaxID=43354 RepID=A0A660CHJ2_9PSEU|nr:DivIVA domain-containing protein [Prauserella rugosa]KID31655.1 DivIVA protein [Prauserella sp. Am3]TWH21113.1 DivIVA domain-containing protein [Prauserella rugosa]
MAEAEASPNPTKSGAFTTVFRGYDQVQVDEHLKKLSAKLEQTSRSRDDATASVAELTKALGHAQQELVETKAALTRMAEEPTGPAAMSERVKTMMKLAEEEIDELRKKAEEEADATRSAADSYSEKTREDARAEAKRLAEEAERERTRLDEEAAKQRADAEKASQDKIAAAEKKSSEEIAAAKAEAEKSAKQLTDDATKRADAMLAEAEAKLADAKAKHSQALELREKVAQQLAASSAAFTDALDKLGSAPEPLAWATSASDGGNGPAKQAGSGSSTSSAAQTTAKGEAAPAEKGSTEKTATNMPSDQGKPSPGKSGTAGKEAASA